jgi:hypothetical protein
VTVQVASKLVFKSRKHIVERKSVGVHQYPSRISSKKSKCLSWPQSIRFVPDSSIRLLFVHVLNESFNVEFPLDGPPFVGESISKDLCPFLAGYEFLDFFLSISKFLELV